MSNTRQFGSTPLRKWTTLFCVLVIAGFGFVQAVHAHNVVDGQSAAAHCSLCVVAHSAAAVTAATAAPAPALETARLAVLEPQLQSQLHVTSSYIRPPPQNL